MHVHFCHVRTIPESFASEEPSEGWERLEDMPEPRSESKALEYNEKIYVIGGLNNKGKADSSVFVYDMNKNSWNDGTPMPTALHHLGAAIHNEKFYVVGGYYDGWIPSNELWIYDVDSDTWSQGADMTTPRGALTVEFLDGKQIFIF